MTFLATLLEDAGYPLPRPGWPGRTRAIVRAYVRLLVEAVTFLLCVAAFSGLVLLVWAARP